MSFAPSESLERQVRELREQGFLIERALVAAERCAELKAIAACQLHEVRQPVEFEADLRYPGAPASKQALGGHTVRRLLDAYTRDAAFAARAVAPEIVAWMQAYFGEQPVLSTAHHNCVMTKHPAYGSLTGWHRDARYWSFERSDLVSVWLALGTETRANGGLWLVPGSHRVELEAECFDTAKFFRSDLPTNQNLIGMAVCPELNAGDVIFFHCNTLHSAGRNLSDQVKFSLVFTYHGAGNQPLSHSRSASKPGVRLTAE